MRERDDLDVDRGIVGAEHLHAELVVLAVPTLLRAFVAKDRRQVPRLPRRSRMVLDERAHYRRGSLRTQREASLAAVAEDVHLVAKDVALLANAAHEDPDVLEDGRNNEREAVAVGQLREGRDETLPLG